MTPEHDRYVRLKSNAEITPKVIKWLSILFAVIVGACCYFAWLSHREHARIEWKAFNPPGPVEVAEGVYLSRR